MHVSTPGGGLTFKRGIFGNLGKLETMMSVCYGRSEELVFSGATTGDVYIWRETTLMKTIKAHDGPVFAMCSLDKVVITFLYFYKTIYLTAFIISILKIQRDIIHPFYCFTFYPSSCSTEDK